MKTTTRTTHRLPRFAFRVLLPLLLLALQPFGPSAPFPPPAQAASKPLSKVKTINSVTNTTRKNARPDGSNGDNSADTGEKWTLELTPSYIRAGLAAIDSYYGASLALGYRITPQDKIQLEIGLYQSGNYSGSISYTQTGAYDTPYQVANPYTMTLNGQKTAKATMLPLLLSYSFCVPIGSSKHFELRFTPAVGYTVMKSSWRINNATGAFTASPGATITSPNPASTTTISPDGTITQTDNLSGNDTTKLAATIGGGISLAYNLAGRYYIAAGYRFLWMDTVGNPLPAGAPPWNGITAWNHTNTHTYSLTLGMKL